MSLYLGDIPICGGIEGNQLNNPFSLLDYKFSEYELSNASWLLSNGQYNSGATYSAVYNLLLQIYNGNVTKAGVSVKLSTEVYADTDFVLNTNDTTFRLPTVVKLASGKAVAGNGMTLGMTDGTNNAGVYFYSSSGYGDALSANINAYGTTTGTSSSGGYLSSGKNVGITTDSTKSGIETSANDLYLYFYVGDTVQDANVIAASQVLTTVADCVRKSSATDRETVVGWGIPDYSAGIALTPGSNPPQLGYVMFAGNNVQNDYALGYIDGVNVFRFGSSAYQGGETAGMYLVDEFNTVTAYKAEIRFYPLKGVN